MPNKKIVTWYEIKEVSTDGLIKDAKSPYESSVFYGTYSTMDEVDEAIVEHGDTYRDYVILTCKKAVPAE